MTSGLTCCMPFFFIPPATTEIYTLSLHDALPISAARRAAATHPPHALPGEPAPHALVGRRPGPAVRDRKSTRLNSSHTVISYAVFCLKKKKKLLCTEDEETGAHSLKRTICEIQSN